jgi:hypothetical protein
MYCTSNLFTFHRFFGAGVGQASKVYQVKEIAKETNPSVNNKRQAIEIRKGITAC